MIDDEELALLPSPGMAKDQGQDEALDCRSYARAAAAVYGMDRFTDVVWQTLEGRLAEMSGHRPAAPSPPQQPRPLRTICFNRLV